LQQVPARDKELGPMIRGLFIPEAGKTWYKFDYCFSDDTEVLTNSGWKLFKDLHHLDLLATYLPNGVIKFDSPSAYQEINYNGNMEHISGKFTDLLVSPQHTCVIGVGEVLRKYKAVNYPKGRYKQYNSGCYQGTLSIGVDLIALICAIQADSKWEHNHKIIFHLKKERKIIRLIEILHNLNIPYDERKYKCKLGFTSIYIQEDSLPKIILQYLSGKEKTFNKELWQLCYEERLVMIKELQFWDGSHGYYCSTNKENVLFANVLFILTNHRSVYKEYYIKGKKPFYHATCSDNTFTWTQRFKQEKIPYNGKIYCVTMPSSTVIVKRNGRVSITGQSQQEPRTTVHYAYLRGFVAADIARQKYIDNPKTDYHQMVADMVGCERRLAKDLNLGLAYGMGISKMASKINRTEKETSIIFNDYHKGVPFVKELSDDCMRIANARGYVKTIMGRRRRFEMWGRAKNKPLPYNEALKEYGLPLKRLFVHKALNSLIQGSCADMMKQAMLNIYEAGFEIPHLTVHDEVDFSLSLEDNPKEILNLLIGVFPEITVPLRVDVEYGNSWGNLTSMED
jgi:hypothetical protein